MKFRFGYILFPAVLGIVLAAADAGPKAGVKKDLVREEVKLIIDGIQETWRLEWASPPISACGPENDDWAICPCSGFAFGEAGDLNLIRQRIGHKDERLSVTDLFKYGDDLVVPDRTILRRWTVNKEDDFSKSGSPAFISRVKARPNARIMRLEDYDHDGRATEFILQIGTEACGKIMSIVVGISRSNPRLHAFTSVKNPKEPLILQRWHWEELAQTKGPVKVVHWPCGDHGSGEETEYELNAEDGRIHVLARKYICIENDSKRGKLEELNEF
jgi:hypothetical protein